VSVAVGVSVGVSVSVGIGVGVSVAVGVGGGVSVAVGTDVSVGVGVAVSVAVGGGVSVDVAIAVGVLVVVGVAGALASEPSRQPEPASTSTGLQLAIWNASASAIFALNSVSELAPIPLIVNGIVATIAFPVGPGAPIEQAMKASPVAGLPSAFGSPSARSPEAGVALQSKPASAVVGVPAVSHAAS
jgi:hypothetical protein